MCEWPQGVPDHTPGKGFIKEGQFRGVVAAFLGGLMHAVDGLAIVRGDGLRDRRGRWRRRRRGQEPLVYDLY